MFGVCILLAANVNSRSIVHESERPGQGSQQQTDPLALKKIQHHARRTCTALYEACYAFSYAIGTSQSLLDSLLQNCQVYYVDMCFTPVTALYQCWQNCSQTSCGLSSHRYQFNGDGFQPGGDSNNQQGPGGSAPPPGGPPGGGSKPNGNNGNNGPNGQGNPRSRFTINLGSNVTTDNVTLLQENFTAPARARNTIQMVAAYRQSAASNTSTNTSANSNTTTSSSTGQANIDYSQSNFPTIKFFLNNCLAVCDCAWVNKFADQQYQRSGNVAAESERMARQLIKAVHKYNQIPLK